MRRDLLREVHGVLLYNFPSPHAGHGLAARIENYVVCGRVGERASEFYPSFQVFFCLASERYQALFVALANWREPFVVEVELG